MKEGGKGREVPVGLDIKRNPLENVNGCLVLRDQEEFD